MFDMEHSKFGFEHSKSDMEHSKFGMEQILCVKIDMLFNFIHAFYIFLTVDFGFSRFLRVKNSWHKLKLQTRFQVVPSGSFLFVH
jgi:hypothetical protein